jgi:hypothetical protein
MWHSIVLLEKKLEMSESASRIKLAEADAMMKNGDKYCKKVLLLI